MKKKLLTLLLLATLFSFQVINAVPENNPPICDPCTFGEPYETSETVDRGSSYLKNTYFTIEPGQLLVFSAYSAYEVTYTGSEQACGVCGTVEVLVPIVIPPDYYRTTFTCPELGREMFGGTITFSQAGWYTIEQRLSTFDETTHQWVLGSVSQTAIVYCNGDSDNDGLDDLSEMNLYGTDPNDSDTDNDGLNDKEELVTYKTNPLVADSDYDGYSDGYEVNSSNTNPLKKDTDGDGINDKTEVTGSPSTDPLKKDTDDDGMDDKFELTYQLNPNSSSDAALDADSDGLTNLQEFQYGTNPTVKDTDGDGFEDKDEIDNYQTNPAKEDSDDDGLPDDIEIILGSNPSINEGIVFESLPYVEGFDSAEYFDGLINFQNYWRSSPVSDGTVSVDQYTKLLAGTSIIKCVGPRKDSKLWFMFKVILNGLNIAPSVDTAKYNNPFAWFYLDATNRVMVANGGVWTDSGVTIQDTSIEHEYCMSVDYTTQKWEIYIDGTLVNSEYDFPTGDYRKSFIYSKFSALQNTLYVNKFGVYNSEPIFLQTADLDSDGMPDAWETKYGVSDPSGDNDNDGLSNLQEYTSKTDPTNIDTDGDGFSDGWEINNNKDPLRKNDEIEYPYHETFAAFYEDPINDQFKWQSYSYDSGGVLVDKCLISDDVVLGNIENDLALKILAHTGKAKVMRNFYSIVEKQLWVEFYATLKTGVEFNVLSALNIDVDSSSNIRVKPAGSSSYTNTTALAQTSLTDDYDWERISVFIDYENLTYTLYLNGSSISSGSFVFDNTKVLKVFSVFGSESTNVYFDDLKISSKEPDNYDVDGDGLSRTEEEEAGTNPYKADTDDDGISDNAEISAASPTDPTNPDSDGDQMPDGWEVANGLNPLSAADAALDEDSDGLTNLQEYQNGTDPDDTDSDDDLMPDGWEVQYQLNPLSATDATADPDNDGLTNLQEYQKGTNPRKADSDGDGALDGWEDANGFDPTTNDSSVDADSDSLPDMWEIEHNVTDASADADADGLTNLQEYQAGTDPNKEDSDGDGINDDTDTSPLVPDGWDDTDGPSIKLNLGI